MKIGINGFGRIGRLAYSDNEKVSLNVGYYYMANAAGRLLGTYYLAYYLC